MYGDSPSGGYGGGGGFNPWGLLNPIGNLIGGAFDYFSQRETNEANKQMTREQMAFQERMSNSAYQRAMADMRMAGLNPMLAAGMGGASTPGGSSANLEAPQIGRHVQAALGSAMDAVRLEADVKQQAAETEKTVVDTANTAQSLELLQEKTKEQRMSNAVQESQLPVEKQRAEVEKGFVVPDAWIKRIGSTLGVVTDALNVKKLFGSPTVVSGSRAETNALRRAGSRGLKVR